MKLSSVQQTIVDYYNSPILVSAGAGSGKTRVLTSKFIHAVNTLGYEPEKILAITFTNRAANEMKRRLVDMTGRSFQDFCWTRTFHSACLEIIKRNVELTGFQSPFSIYDKSSQSRVLKDVLKSLSIDIKEYALTYLSIISDSKNVIDCNQVLDKWVGIVPKPKEVFHMYNDILRRSNAMDFNDILVFAYKLLKEHKDVQKFYQDYFRYIFVDEFQDTNEIQNEIVKLLYKENNLCVVGDDWQSIYSWRGAEPKFFINFEESFPNFQIFKLEQNYRSTKPIVNTGNNIITKNTFKIEKECFSEKNGHNPILFRFHSDEVESNYITDICKKYHDEYNISYDDMAILYRVKQISRVYESSLNLKNIPYEIIGDLEFFQRKEIKDIIAYMVYSINRKDSESLRRILTSPRKGFGTSTLEDVLKVSRGFLDKSKLKLNKKQTKNLSSVFNILNKIQKLSPLEAIRVILTDTEYYDYLKYISTDEDNYNDRCGYIDELIAIAQKYNTINEFMDEISLLSDNDNEDSIEKIKLMTIHASKGTEFRIVFVVGCEEGVFPHWKSIKGTSAQLEEERRLFYVACTRASEYLNVSFSLNRSCTFGKGMSSFIKEVRSQFQYIEIDDFY